MPSSTSFSVNFSLNQLLVSFLTSSVETRFCSDYFPQLDPSTCSPVIVQMTTISQG